MFGITVEVEFADIPESVPVGGSLSLRDGLLTILTTWWADRALDPFLRFPAHQRLRPIDMSTLLLGQPVTYRVRFDENLLADLLEAYAVHGWAAIEEVEDLVSRQGQVVRPTLNLVRETRDVISLLVGDTLIRLESTAVEFGRQRWEAAGRKLDAWIDKFIEYPQLHSFPIFADRKLDEQLVNECHEYALLRSRVVALQEGIDERNRKVPASRRAKGSGADLWFEFFAKPQRELLGKMADQLGRIGKTFGAAVLVLDDLPNQLLDVHDVLHQRYASVALSRAIHSRLTDLRSGVDTLSSSLDKQPVTAFLAPMVEAVKAGDLTALGQLKPPPGGYEQQTLDAVFARTEDDDQRLLADLGLLMALQESAEIAPGTMESIVLFHYVNRLADEVDRRRQESKQWAKFWNVLEKVGAALGLIALMASFPFSDAAAPALVSALVLAGSAAAVIGVVVLLLHQILGVMQEAGQAERDTRERLFRLGQDDPDALSEIAQALARSRALRESVAQGAILTVLSLGAARKITVVSMALETQGFLSDIETVFSAEPSAGE